MIEVPIVTGRIASCKVIQDSLGFWITLCGFPIGHLHDGIILVRPESFLSFCLFAYFLGGYVPPGTPNWHPVLKTISPKIDTPF